MFQIFQESGIGGWLVLLFTIMGLAAVTTVGRRWGRPGSIAGAWAAAILAAGAIGFGTGQRATNRALGFGRANQSGQAREIPAEAVAMLSRGTSEAAGNYVLAGNGALLVLLTGGLLVLFRKKDATAAPAPAPAAAAVKAT